MILELGIGILLAGGGGFLVGWRRLLVLHETVLFLCRDSLAINSAAEEGTGRAHSPAMGKDDKGAYNQANHAHGETSHEDGEDYAGADTPRDVAPGVVGGPDPRNCSLMGCLVWALAMMTVAMGAVPGTHGAVRTPVIPVRLERSDQVA